jgi:tRNA threonylcarbamoyladenosine biosynthesis protein TsaB
MLLAIDTSTTQAGIACIDEQGMLAECAWHAGRNHGAQVLPQIHMLMQHVQCDGTCLQAVGVALGPGSWSGLRVGMSIAKGLVFAGNMTIIGIGTLDALAYQYRQPTLPIYPLISLGRERFATAEFLSTDEFNRVSEYRNVSLDDLCEQIVGEALFCGDIDDAVQQRLRQKLGRAALFPPMPTSLRRPGYLAELAWQRFRQGNRDDLARLEPIYLGEPVRTTP